MLYTPVYDTRTRAFCGPTAMAAVTGEPISVIRDVLRKASGREFTADGRAHPIMGVSNETLIKGMEMLGWNVVQSVETENAFYSKKDVFRFGDFLDAHGDGGPFIVNVTGHYYAVSQGELCDTSCKLPLEISKFRRGRKRFVKRWWQFATNDSGYVPYDEGLARSEVNG